MKTVVKTLVPSDQTLVENVNERKYYGFMLTHNSPGLIIKDNFLGEEKYMSMFFLDITRGNKWGRSSTLKGCIEHLLSHENKHNPPQVFEFNTYKELFKWASEQ